jgi:hypothetical protein
VCLQDFRNRVELQITSWRQSVAGPLPALQLLAVVPGGLKGITHQLLHTHPRLGIPRRVVVAPVGLLDVFPERKLDPLRRRRQLHLFRQPPPAEFDHLILAADRIRRAVQDVGRGHAAGKLPVDRDVIGVDEVADPHLSGDGLRAFVDPAIGRHVGMAVDDARRDMPACEVNHHRVRRHLQILPHGVNLPINHKH